MKRCKGESHKQREARRKRGPLVRVQVHTKEDLRRAWDDLRKSFLNS